MKRCLAVTKELARSTSISYQQPTEFTYFSYNEKRELLFQSREALKYYYPAPNGIDLGEGYPENFIERSVSGREPLDALLMAFKRWKKQTNASVKPQFLTWRGIITKIMILPYQTTEARLRATRFQDTIFIEEVDIKESEAHRNKKYEYYGYKYENVSSVSKNPKDMDPNDPILQERMTSPVNTNVQFCSVIKSKIGSFDIVMGAEVDCMNPDKLKKDYIQSAYIELKTNRTLKNQHQTGSLYRFKMLRVWAQSFLAGVPRIIMGFHQDGILKQSVTYHTNEIPNHSAVHWNPKVCIQFLHHTLEFIHSHIVDDEYVYELILKPTEVELIGPVSKETFLCKEYLSD